MENSISQAKKRVAARKAKSDATIALCTQMILSTICLPVVNLVFVGFALSGLSKPRSSTMNVIKSLCYFQGAAQMLIFIIISVSGTLAYILIDCLRDFARFVELDTLMITSRRVLIASILLTGISVISAVHAGRLCQRYASNLKSLEVGMRKLRPNPTMTYEINYPLQVLDTDNAEQYQVV